MSTKTAVGFARDNRVYEMKEFFAVSDMDAK